MNKVRYFVIKDHLGNDCLRVEMDDHVAGITCTAVIPIYDLEKAITQYRADWYKHTNRRVRVSNDPDSMPVGFAVSVRDADTGEMIENVAQVVITLFPEMLNTAELTFFDFGATGTESLRTVLEVVDHPEVDLTVYVRGGE